ncbi:hypothetical protein D3C76_1362600 [compost metagenome]
MIELAFERGGLVPYPVRRTAQRVGRLAHAFACALAQLAGPVAHIMGLHAHLLAGIVHRVPGMGEGILNRVDRITELLAQP